MNWRTGSGTFWPDASTGISSYFSKLIPVCCLVGSSTTPKSSRSSRTLAGPATCFPSRHCPSPLPRAEILGPPLLPPFGLPYPFLLKAAAGCAVSQPGRPPGAAPFGRGVKSGAFAQFPPGRGPSDGKPLALIKLAYAKLKLKNRKLTQLVHSTRCLRYHHLRLVGVHR